MIELLRQRSTQNWILLNIIVPLLPVCLAALIRLIIRHGEPTWHTLDADELAFSLALIIVFVQQSLHKSDVLLNNTDKKGEMESYYLVLLVLFIVLLICFCINVGFQAQSDKAIEKLLDHDDLDSTVR